MRVIFHSPGREFPADITGTQFGQDISKLAISLRACGDDDADILDAIQDVCDGEQAPLLLDHAEISSEVIDLHCNDLDLEAQRGREWRRQQQD